MDLYTVKKPINAEVPIIVSVPHCGTFFPSEIIKHYKAEKIQQPDDTDWFVHRLYDFVQEMGITLIYANYSRWVIDLNRDPQSKPLYDDGRIITSLTPVTDFFGNSIYKSPNDEPNAEEVQRRLEKYYWNYYYEIQNLIDDKLKTFGKVLLWDAHSIRRVVPTISKEPFPDMILGDNDEKTAHPLLIETALKNLKSSVFEVNHNTPFKGGHITRYFGKPQKNVHALQLEMSKTLYMNDDEIDYSEKRASEIRDVLQKTFSALIQALYKI